MDLEDYISEPRLKIYETLLKLRKEEVTGAYNWNKSLSSAMQPLMHCLEVTFRNSIDCSIRQNPLPEPHRNCIGQIQRRLLWGLTISDADRFGRAAYRPAFNVGIKKPAQRPV